MYIYASSRSTNMICLLLYWLLGIPNLLYHGLIYLVLLLSIISYKIYRTCKSSIKPKVIYTISGANAHNNCKSSNSSFTVVVDKGTQKPAVMTNPKYSRSSFASQVTLVILLSIVSIPNRVKVYGLEQVNISPTAMM